MPSELDRSVGKRLVHDLLCGGFDVLAVLVDQVQDSRVENLRLQLASGRIAFGLGIGGFEARDRNGNVT